MTRFSSLFILCLSLFACNQPASRLQDKRAMPQQLDSLLDKWHEHAAKGNFEAYFASTHDQFVFLGTDSSERWSKEDFMSFCKPHFEDGKGWDFTVLSRNWMANSDSSVWWFDEQLDTWMKDCRGSGVVLFDKQQAKIAHYNLSVTVENDLISRYIILKDSLHGK